MNAKYDINEVVKYIKESNDEGYGVVKEVCKKVNSDEIIYFEYLIYVEDTNFMVDETDIHGRYILDERDK